MGRYLHGVLELLKDTTDALILHTEQLKRARPGEDA
jgi:hypothetical protein